MNLSNGIFRMSVRYNKDYNYKDKDFIESVFTYLTEQANLCQNLLDIYYSKEQTKFIKDTVARTRTIVSNYVNDHYKCTINTPGENAKQKTQERIDHILNTSPFKSVDTMIPTNTAQNIVDHTVSQIANDPIPIKYTTETNEFIDNVMFNSSWEQFMKRAIRDACTMGVSAISLNYEQSDKMVYLDNENVINCAFITQGANIKYAYMKTIEKTKDSVDTIYHIYDKDNISIMKNGVITEVVAHMFGVCPLQAIVFCKDKGIYENSLGDIGVYDASYYLAVHTMTDPKNVILDGGIITKDITYNSTKELMGANWLAKPTADILNILEYVRKEAQENIIDDTNVVPERMLRTQINTATQSNHLLDKFNSMIQSYGNMIKQRMSPVLRGLENIGKVLDNKQTYELSIEPSAKEVVNNSQRAEMIQPLDMPIEVLKFLGYSKESINMAIDEDIELKKRYADLQVTEFMDSNIDENIDDPKE